MKAPSGMPPPPLNLPPPRINIIEERKGGDLPSPINNNRNNMPDFNNKNDETMNFDDMEEHTSFMHSPRVDGGPMFNESSFSQDISRV